MIGTLIFQKPIEGEIAPEEAERLGIKPWLLSSTAIAAIIEMEENSKLAAVYARDILLD